MDPAIVAGDIIHGLSGVFLSCAALFVGKLSRLALIDPARTSRERRDRREARWAAQREVRLTRFPHPDLTPYPMRE